MTITGGKWTTYRKMAEDVIDVAAREDQIGGWIQFRLLDKQGKVLLNKPNLEFHQPYQIATNPSQYFDESEASMKRLSDDVAKTVVSAILEQF